MSDRLPCCVPFCKRTTKAGRFAEWVCADHWRIIPLMRRRLYARLLKRGRGSLIWPQLKREIIEVAAGIRR